MDEETLFRDDEVFNPDYIPDQFRFRDPQLEEMGHALRPVMRGGRASNTFLVGPPATGKTTAVRNVFSELRSATEKAVAVHINCHIQPSAYKIFSAIHRSLFGILPPDTGIPLTKVQEDVFNRLAREKKALVIALDDINFLFANNTANDILYSILRAHESYEKAKTSVFAVATEDLLHVLDERVRSIFHPVRIEFPRYNIRETYSILKKRCIAGLQADVITDSVLRKIVSNTDDLRFGIELIKQSALAAEADASRRIAVKHVDRALKDITIVKTKNDEAKLLEKIKKHGPIESGMLYDIVKKGKNISYTTYYRSLQKLRASNMIKIKPAMKKKGKTSIIEAVK